MTHLQAVFNDETALDRPDLMTGAEYAVAFAAMEQDYFGKPSVLPAAVPPVLLYVTGIPGAGKSTWVQNHIRHGWDMVINFDQLREYHPRYQQHRKENPVNAAARTDQAVEGLVAWLCEEAAKRKRHVVLDDAAMGAEITELVLSPFKARGYKVDAVVLSVPAVMAQQSVRLRFEEAWRAAQEGALAAPRWVNATEQAAAPAALVETVKVLEEKQLARSIQVVGRGGETVFFSQGEGGAAALVAQQLGRPLAKAERVIFEKSADEIAHLEWRRASAALQG